MRNFNNSSGWKITLKILLFICVYIFGICTSNWWSNKIMDIRKTIAIKLYPIEQKDSTIQTSQKDTIIEIVSNIKIDSTVQTINDQELIDTIK